MDPSTLDDDALLSLGLHCLHEILSRRLHQVSSGQKTSPKVRGPKAKKAIVALSDDDVPLDLLNIQELSQEAYDSPPPRDPATAAEAPGAPKKKKTPAKGKQAAVEAMFKVPVTCD